MPFFFVVSCMGHNVTLTLPQNAVQGLLASARGTEFGPLMDSPRQSNAQDSLGVMCRQFKEYEDQRNHK